MMPSLTMERPQMTVEMWEALKSHIMRQRQKRKQEQEQDAAQERQRKEQELRRKQNAMTLEDIKDQLTKLETKLKELKEEKHELFSQLKKVLNEDDMNSKKQRELELIAQNTFLSAQIPPYNHYLSGFLPVSNGLQNDPNLLTYSRPSVNPLTSFPSLLPSLASSTSSAVPLNSQQLSLQSTSRSSNISYSKFPSNFSTQPQFQQKLQQVQQMPQSPSIQNVNHGTSQQNLQNSKKFTLKRPHEKSPSPPIAYTTNYKTSISYTPSIPKTSSTSISSSPSNLNSTSSSSSSSSFIFYPGAPLPISYDIKNNPFHIVHPSYTGEISTTSSSHESVEYDSKAKYFPIRGLVSSPTSSIIPIQPSQTKPGGITSGFPLQRNVSSSRNEPKQSRQYTGYF